MALELMTPSPSVVCLFLRCGPSTVAWFVVAVVIDAVKGMRRCWPLTHVGEEVLELPPALAYGDATPAVAIPLLMSHPRAARDHRFPRSVNRSRPAPFAALPAMSMNRLDTALKGYQGRTVFQPTLVMQEAPAVRFVRTCAAIYRTGWGVGSRKLIGHLGSNLLGVMRTAVPAARPLNFTPMEGR